MQLSMKQSMQQSVRQQTDEAMALHKAAFKSGDIIFTSIPNRLYQHVEAATDSPASHVGILFEDAARGWLVAESRVPCCTYSTLESFIGRSKNGWFCVRRPRRELDDMALSRLRAACNQRMGCWYHLGFRYESKRQFCSKFVYEVYQQVLDIEIGELETFEHLLSRNPNASRRFWYLWFLGRIPWQRLTITPASQYLDQSLETVFEEKKSPL